MIWIVLAVAVVALTLALFAALVIVGVVTKLPTRLDEIFEHGYVAGEADGRRKAS